MTDTVKARTMLQLKVSDLISVPSYYFKEDNDMESGPSKYIGKIISTLTGDLFKVWEKDTYTSLYLEAAFEKILFIKYLQYLENIMEELLLKVFDWKIVLFHKRYPGAWEATTTTKTNKQTNKQTNNQKRMCCVLRYFTTW